MTYENDTMRLVALTADELRAFDERPTELLARLGVVDTAFFVAPKLKNANETYFLPRLADAPAQDYFFHTRWLAIDKTTKQLVAELLIKQGPDARGAIEIGYGVYPSVEGKGYMTAAVGCLLQWALTEGRIKRVWAETRRDNIASIKVLIKNGFVQTGETDRYLYWAVEWI